MHRSLSLGSIHASILFGLCNLGETGGGRRETRDEDCVHRADTARSFHRILPHRQQTAWLIRRTNLPPSSARIESCALPLIERTPGNLNCATIQFPSPLSPLLCRFKILVSRSRYAFHDHAFRLVVSGRARNDG